MRRTGHHCLKHLSTFAGMVSVLFSITANAAITVKNLVDFGDVPKGSNVWQPFTLCTDYTYDQDLAFEMSGSGLELYYHKNKKAHYNRIELPGRSDSDTPKCTTFYLLVKTRYAGANNESRSIKINLSSDNGEHLLIPINGSILNKDQWLKKYPGGNTEFIYTGSMKFNDELSPDEQGFNSRRGLTTNMIFDGAGDLAVIFERNFQSKMQCIHKKTVVEQEISSWSAIAEHDIPEGACGLAVSKDDQIALTSDLSSELIIYDGCREATPVANTSPGARYLNHACNVAFVNSRHKGIKNLVTLARDSHYAPSIGNQVWLTLWNADMNTGKIDYYTKNVHMVSYDSTPAFVTSHDVIGVKRKSDEHTQLAVTNLKSSDYFVAHYNVNSDHQLTRSIETESSHSNRFAVKQLMYHDNTPYRASISELGNTVVIEFCEENGRCIHHQTITAMSLYGEDSLPFTPTHVSFANAANWLVITDKHNGILLLKPSPDMLWGLHQTLRASSRGEQQAHYNKALFSPLDINLAALSADNGFIHFFEWASCQSLKSRFTWTEVEVPEWWQQFVRSKCPKLVIKRQN